MPEQILSPNQGEVAPQFRHAPDESNQHTMIFSAAKIAELTAENPDRWDTPTDEQSAVIEQPLDGVVLVLAGAGSGKTETMANRVVWLIANGLVTPNQILGLTFTRKAAGELGERVVQRLLRCSAHLNELATKGALNPDELVRAAALSKMLNEDLELPEVSTYNSFASGVVQEFGAAAGVAAGNVLIDQATAWGIAREIVRSSNEPELVTLDASMSSITQQVIDLDHAVADNLTTFDAVQHELALLSGLSELPYNSKVGANGKVYAGIAKLDETFSQTELIVKLSREYAAEKHRLGLIEFSDQLAMAVETLERLPRAAQVLASRTPAVLLDEVQDTSVGQTRLLSTLFRGVSVMAVGDPHQSIYAFRGASASNLSTFHQDFSSKSEPQQQLTLSLSVSFRNSTPVLTAANLLSGPLVRSLTQNNDQLSVQKLISLPEYLRQKQATQELALQQAADLTDTEQVSTVVLTAEHPVELRYVETIGEEFSEIADWLFHLRQELITEYCAAGHAQKLPTAAVVCRARAHMPAIAEALTLRGIPNQIVGIGGLLSTPEVTDIVSVLRCLWFADAESELIRILTGPRFRLGVADVHALRSSAKWFAERDHLKQKLSPDERAAAPVLPDPDRDFTLLDVLDEFANLGPEAVDTHRAAQALSDTAKHRACEAGEMLRELRSYVGGDVLLLIRMVEQALRLDIELDANEGNGHGGAASARANIEAFSLSVENFLAIDERGSFASLILWLERAAQDDETPEHVPEPTPGTVQIITVHGSKGLGWDLVAVPRLVEKEFPKSPREVSGWLGAGKLPDQLRGDAAARPALEFADAATQKDVLDLVDDYRQQHRDRHLAEERRLVYVAVTRTKQRLLLTGSFWGGHKTPRHPSMFLRELFTSAHFEKEQCTDSQCTDNHYTDERGTNEHNADNHCTAQHRADSQNADSQNTDSKNTDSQKSDQHNADFVMGDEPSGFIIGELPGAPASAEDPTGGIGRTILWPLDPLGARATRVFAAAQAVRNMLAETTTSALAAAESRSAALSMPQKMTTVDLLLQELHDQRSTHTRETELRSVMPNRISASSFHTFVEDPHAAGVNLLRPMPSRPYRGTRLGNRFHEWVERRTTTALGSQLTLLDVAYESELSGGAYENLEFDDNAVTGNSSDLGDKSDSIDETAFESSTAVINRAISIEETDHNACFELSADSVSDPTQDNLMPRESDLAVLIDHFESSRWADLRPIAVELEITIPFAGRRLVCKLDAVYQHGSQSKSRYEVVDWKTGRPPKNNAERSARFLQLELYRHAFAQFSGAAPENIDVVLFYVADGVELRGESSLSFAELESRWLEAETTLLDSE